MAISIIDDTVMSYKDIKRWKDENILKYRFSHQLLNEFHDEIMCAVVKLAVKRQESERGKAPAHFAFFVMGSGGRSEQLYLSDQDHGIVFSSSGNHQSYFLELGEEIVHGLALCGYEKCEGKVMSDNPVWNRSEDGWKRQISDWLDEEDWDSLRHVSIFFDARVLFGDPEPLHTLKQHLFKSLSANPGLITRLTDNVQYIKKGVGMLGNILPRQAGKEKGLLDFKETVLFPFVNGARLLAFSEQRLETSTISRLQCLPAHLEQFKSVQPLVEKMLNYRMRKADLSKGYSLIHLIDQTELSKEEKREIKLWMKEGTAFMKDVTAALKRRHRK
ncbi:DUF294 nucleotidyltransferase-like domain-containing protein [Salipaludibacillus aurantiacus]|uniref:CBS domain-containing protein n=1 Tax=Salipaludibacillus aurantiacus TaxID=1601833 RepID=A0A1H9VR26_9BACI|nr:DUF294 nucleotidyltransferase-like domain-containing protein [Salipaludibacillus aurantiacus]SES24052.1 CBS domain-containing protein [Salipaludibacillus aurantiacus]